jgi:DNA-binding transcriptional LysR family regulator
VSNFDAVARLVEAGVGVAVMPRSAADRWRDARVRIAPLKDAWTKRRLLICSTVHAETLPSAQALVKALLAA